LRALHDHRSLRRSAAPSDGRRLGGDALDAWKLIATGTSPRETPGAPRIVSKLAIPDRSFDLGGSTGFGTGLPFLNTYRTMCIDPEPHFQRLLEEIAAVQVVQEGGMLGHDR